MRKIIILGFYLLLMLLAGLPKVGAKDLITNAKDGTAGCQFMSNAVEPNEGSFSNLLDGRASTIFHSIYSEYGPSSYHNLQVRLDSAVQKFYIKFTAREGVNHDTPKHFKLYATNDATLGNDANSDDAKWSLVSEVNDESIPNTSAYVYVSAPFEMDKAYKFIRMVVIETTSSASGRINGRSGLPYFNLGEFQLMTEYKPDTLSADYAGPLILDANDGSPLCQILSNAKEPSEGSFANLIDGNLTTHFHSIYSSAGPSGYHNLQVKLPRAMNDFFFQFTARQGNYHDTPNHFKIYMTNDDALGNDATSADDKWTLIREVNDATIENTSTYVYTSEQFKLDKPYKYFRMVVIGTTSMSQGRVNGRTGLPYFNLSEFQIITGFYPADHIGNQDIVINEVMTANVDFKMSPAWNFDGWIELYNKTDQDIWLGSCYLSNDAKQPTLWRLPITIGKLPAKGFRTVWLGSNAILAEEAPFKLDEEGGTILLSNPDGSLITSFSYPACRTRLAYARKTDGGKEWGWTAEPTPGTTNETSTFPTEQLEKPIVTPDGRLFSSAQSVQVTNIPEGAILRYTRDGTTPTLTNGMSSTTGRVSCQTNTSFRFRFFQKGKLPSEVTTRTYLKKDRDYTLPIISISTVDDYLYDDSIGVYVKGVNGISGRGQSTPCNWNMDWDRPVNFQYLLPETNEMAINQDVDFSITGGWTRANNLKAFKLKAQRIYENQNYLPYAFFSQKPYLKNKTVQVRAGGNDSYCRIKDAALQCIMIAAGLNIDLISYEPTTVFLNGVFKGVINLREPTNKDFAYANFGYKKDEVEVFEQSAEKGAYMMVGTFEILNLLYQLAQKAADDATYEEIKQLLDVDEFAYYMASKIYLGPSDWLGNNTKAYRKVDGGRFRYVMYDLDSSFGTYSNNIYNPINGGGNDFCRLFLNLLNNKDFRRRFIDATCLMGGSVFTAEKIEPILAAMEQRVATSMSWTNESPTSSLNEIRSKLPGRVAKTIQDMKSFSRLQLSTATPQSIVLSSNNAEATLMINDEVVPYNKFDGQLFAPVTFKAIAPAGCKFTGWKKFTSDAQQLVEKGSTWFYYDQGSLDGKNWQDINYNTSNWKSGAAPLGYGNNMIATTISYGTSLSAKRPTYYFRHTFNLTEEEMSNDVELDYSVDDGFIIYVNGKEIARKGLSGNVTYSTYATQAKSNPEPGSLTIPIGMFKKGQNIIAVEVHNVNASSSDIFWEASLSTVATHIDETIFSQKEEVSMPSGQSFSLMACFTPMTEDEYNKNGGNPVVINELSCQNDIFVNEYFDRKDWVELYNRTAEDIDLEGMYLSNDPNQLLKYQITGGEGETKVSTIIPAYGYKIIWCDEKETQSQLHAPFKINAGGGTVFLTAADKSWTDHLTYTPHSGNETQGRWPDGNDNVYTLNVPTIAGANMKTSYMAQVEQPDIPTGINNTLSDKRQDIKIHYAASRLSIRNYVVGSPIRLIVVNVSGQKVMDGSLTPNSPECFVNVNNLPSGIYVARVINEKGNSVTYKFIK